MTIGTLILFVFSSIVWITGFLECVEVLRNFADRWAILLAASLYAITVYELFFHLVLGHPYSKINPSRVFFRILVFLTSTAMLSSSIRSMILMHDTHHIYADQKDRDYLSWKQRWMTTVPILPLMLLWEPNKLVIPNIKQFIESQKSKYSYLVDDDWIYFCDQHQLLLSVCWLAALYFVAPTLFYTLCLARFMISFIVFINTMFGHNKMPFGYRNFNTPDKSHNNLLTHYLWLGCFSAALHNNHHGMDFSRSHASKWFEIDVGSMILNFAIKPLIEHKRPKVS